MQVCIPLKWTKNETDQEQANFEINKTSLIHFFMIKTLKRVIILQAVTKNLHLKSKFRAIRDRIATIVSKLTLLVSEAYLRSVL